MDRVYTICVAIGFGIPLLSLVLGKVFDFLDGIFDGIFDLLNFDFSFDIGDTSVCFLPFSIQSICGGLLIYGTVGKLFYNGHNAVIVNIIAVGLGYLIAVILQTMIHKLKKVENTTISMEQLLLYDAKVINTIVANGYGSISVTTLDGITSSYPAKAEEKDVSIKQDSIVSIVRFEKNIAIVREKDLIKKYE
ncbi:hypothetical protein [Clostridium sp. Marseille-P299]|uniref:hypothetical protein n=1 Tax=Clostridium sp. Marseille-P299 TaxID=1805477 RepID=UPI00082DCB63|nr:hypothetical protein [Clostridium sp. Marseille-P299]